jgi:hypothetical protein
MIWRIHATIQRIGFDYKTPIRDLISTVESAKLGSSLSFCFENESLVRMRETILELYVQHLPAIEMRFCYLTGENTIDQLGWSQSSNVAG